MPEFYEDEIKKPPPRKIPKEHDRSFPLFLKWAEAKAAKLGVKDVGALLDNLDPMLTWSENATLFWKAVEGVGVKSRTEDWSEAEAEGMYVQDLVDQLEKRGLKVLTPEQEELLETSFDDRRRVWDLQKEIDELKVALEEERKVKPMAEAELKAKEDQIRKKEAQLKDWETKLTGWQFEAPEKIAASTFTTESRKKLSKLREEEPGPARPICPMHKVLMKDLRDLTSEEVTDIFKFPIEIAEWAHIYQCPEDKRLYESFRGKFVESRPDLLERKKAIVILERPPPVEEFRVEEYVLAPGPAIMREVTRPPRPERVAEVPTEETMRITHELWPRFLFETGYSMPEYNTWDYDTRGRLWIMFDLWLRRQAPTAS